MATILPAGEPVTVIGPSIRTTNAEAGESIPALWHEVRTSGVLDTVPGRISGDVYAVYTHLENAGVSNAGHFTFLIGVPVAPDTPVPDGLALVTIPSSPRVSFAVPDDDPARVLEAWQQAWAYDDDSKSFLCEFELYAASGAASVNIGLRAP